MKGRFISIEHPTQRGGDNVNIAAPLGLTVFICTKSTNIIAPLGLRSQYYGRDSASPQERLKASIVEAYAIKGYCLMIRFASAPSTRTNNMPVGKPAKSSESAWFVSKSVKRHSRNKLP